MAQEIPSIPPTAIHCISGLVYLELGQVDGKDKPGPEDIVRAIITPVDGEAKNSSGDDQIQTLSLDKVGPGLSEAFQLMAPGQKLRIWVPASLEKTASKEKEANLSVYDLELIAFQRTKEPPVIPDHLISPGNDQ